MIKNQYPKIGLRSKNEIAKRISSKKLSTNEALILINDVLKNFDSYWYDSKNSKPEEQKFVRSATKSPALKKLLKLISEKILKPYDVLVPEFMFGGLSGKNNIQATRYLLGEQRDRTLLKLDVKTFFEQVKQERVFYFFYKKCQCTVEASRILASLCCVPRGKKGSGSNEKILARGFATSSRLSMWCNLGTFQHLDWKMKKKLKRKKKHIKKYMVRIKQKKIQKIILLLVKVVMALLEFSKNIVPVLQWLKLYGLKQNLFQIKVQKNYKSYLQQVKYLIFQNLKLL